MRLTNSDTNMPKETHREAVNPKGLTKTKEDLAISLFNIGAIKFGAFRLKLHETNPNAPLSPIYIDLRILQSHPDAMDRTVAVLQEMTRDLTFDVYAPIPQAATPIGAVLSHRTRTPMITPRPPKTHGTGGGIDGYYEKGQTALVIDDLVTKADSKLEAIRGLEEKGLKVTDVVVLVDREQGGTEQLKKLGYTLYAAFKLSELLRFYLKTDRITPKQFSNTMSYLSS